MIHHILCEKHNSRPDGHIIALEGSLRGDQLVDVYLTAFSPQRVHDTPRDVLELADRLIVPPYLSEDWYRVVKRPADPWPWPPSTSWFPSMPTKSIFYALGVLVDMGATEIEVHGWDPGNDQLRMDRLVKLMAENGHAVVFSES